MNTTEIQPRLNLVTSDVDNFYPLCRATNHDTAERTDRDIWELVSCDSALSHLHYSMQDVMYHLGTDGYDKLARLISELEEELYDKLARKHQPPSKEYAKFIKRA